MTDSDPKLNPYASPAEVEPSLDSGPGARPPSLERHLFRLKAWCYATGSLILLISVVVTIRPIVVLQRFPLLFPLFMVAGMLAFPASVIALTYVVTTMGNLRGWSMGIFAGCMLALLGCAFGLGFFVVPWLIEADLRQYERDARRG